jgi:Fe-S-cluster containining protein
MTRVIRCTDCPGLCCSAFDAILLDPGDAPRLAKALGMTRSGFARKYLTFESAFDMLVRTLDGTRVDGQRVFIELHCRACPFLNGKTGRCTVYAARPRACRVFKPGNNYCRQLRRLHAESENG